MMVRLLGFAATLLVILVGSRVLVTHADGVARQIIAARGQGSTTHHGHRLGRSVTLPTATHRPPLRVTAERAGTVHRVRTTPYLYDGNRFFGVRLMIHNAGQRPWVSQPGTTYHVTDALGVTHTGGTAIRIREGRVLEDPVRAGWHSAWVRRVPGAGQPAGDGGVRHRGSGSVPHRRMEGGAPVAPGH